ncbi:tetratricopeptide repeat protein [Sphingobium scionense]
MVLSGASIARRRPLPCRCPDEAAAAFRQALIQAPNNGWALYGLARAEAAQGHKAEAAAARNAFDRAWSGNPDWLRIDRL